MANKTQQIKGETKAMDQRIPFDYEHDFVLVLTGVDGLSPEAADALFEAGCDDATISIRSGRVFLTFSRNATSIREAILSAIRNVREARIGAEVLRVDHCDLVTQSEIARKIDRTRQQVFQYISGERGPGGFPPPACHITDKAPLWKWCEVAHWLWQNGMLKENALRAAQDVDTINCVLDFVHKKHADPDFVEQFFSELQGSGAENTGQEVPWP